MRAGDISCQFGRAGPPASLTFFVRHDTDFCSKTRNETAKHYENETRYLLNVGLYACKLAGCRLQQHFAAASQGLRGYGREYELLCKVRENSRKLGRDANGPRARLGQRCRHNTKELNWANPPASEDDATPLCFHLRVLERPLSRVVWPAISDGEAGKAN